MDYPVALLSDIHGNIEALTKVVADIKSQGITSIINMGDTVGYGPNPEKCLDIVQNECTLNLCGNHDYAVLHDAEGFNPIAHAAVDYARSILDPSQAPDDADRRRRWEFLGDLEPIYEGEGYEAMHGSPRQPITEYVLPSDPEVEPFKMRELFAAMHRPVAFVGHTHYPGVIEEGASTFMVPGDFDGTYELKSDCRAIVNVGSVGQPRDRDIRSCYVIFDGKSITWRRVEYDLETTINKINETNGMLHEICGLRLREGR